MNRFVLSSAAVAVVCMLCACSQNVPAITARAKIEAPSCADASAWQDDLMRLEANSLLRVEPTYWVDTCSGAAQVTGVKLHVRPTERGWSGSFRRVLQCSSARVRVGQVDRSRPRDDSLWLPEGWVDIEVQREDAHFSVWLSADSVAKNLQLLRRITALASARRSAGQ